MSQSIRMTNLEYSGGDFLDEASAIDQNITEINANVQRIRELQQSIITSTSTQQEAYYAQQRDALAASTKNLYTQVKDRIKHLGKIRSSDGGALRQTQYQRLREKFTKSLNQYQNVEEAYMASQKDKITRQYRVVNPSATQQEIDSYVNNSSNQPIFQQSLLRTGEAREAAAEVEKRHNDIKQIEQTISELVDLTQQLALQVEMQDDVLVGIENNVESTGHKLNSATEELAIAQKLGISARKKKWICLGITIVIIAIVVIVVVIYVRPSQK